MFQIYSCNILANESETFCVFLREVNQKIQTVSILSLVSFHIVQYRG